MYRMNTNLKQFILQCIMEHKCYNKKFHGGITISIWDFKYFFELKFQKTVVVKDIKNVITLLCREKSIKDSSEVIVYNDDINGKICIDLN